jgi:archaellum component FlaF (FlaF/FlaG flagellin family)
MESGLISDILKFLTQVGPFQGVLILFAVASILVIGKYLIRKMDSAFVEIKQANEMLKKEIDNLNKKNEEIITSIENASKKRMDEKLNFLKNHPYFSTIDYMIDVKISEIYFKSEFKKIAFTDILTFKLRSSQETFRAFVSNESNYINGDLEFRNLVTRNLRDAYGMFMSECQRSKIPQVVLESFNSWTSPLTRFLFSTLEDICESKLYETNVDKLNAILNIMLAVFNEIITNIELYLDEINGDFQGETYKGITADNEH